MNIAKKLSLKVVTRNNYILILNEMYINIILF